MSDFSSQLGLSGATLQRLSDAYEGYAAASGIAAAIYRSILDPASSIPLFGIAAGIYRRQNNSLWKPLAICSLNREWLFGQEAGQVEDNPAEFFYELLRQYYLFNVGDENALGRMLEHASSSPALLAQPVGNPPLPLHDYIGFVRGDIEKAYYDGDPAENGNRAWAAGLRVLLQRTAEQLRQAQSNRFPWQSEVGLLPFGPDILATLLGFCIRDRNRGEIHRFAEAEEARFAEAEEARHESPALFLIRIALEMIVAAL